MTEFKTFLVYLRCQEGHILRFQKYNIRIISFFVPYIKDIQGKFEKHNTGLIIHQKMITKTKILTIVILSLLFSVNLNAQCINGVKSYPIYKKGAQLVEKFDNEDAEIVRIEYDLIFSSKESFRNLTSDWEYAIIGFADNGVKDLNINLYEYDDLLEKWKLVSEDKSTDPYAIVNYKPSVAGKYKVEVIVQEFYEGYNAARYGLMFVHD